MLAEPVIDVKDSISETVVPTGVDMCSGYWGWLFFLYSFDGVAPLSAW
jgi:hypothetical protein